MENGLTTFGLAITLLIALLGWAYQLGFLSSKIQRNEKDIEDLKALQQQDEKDMRNEIRDNFAKVFSKIDELPCHNPKWRNNGC